MLAADDDPVVKQAAILQLWRQGRTEAAEPKRDELRRAHGDALREAAQFLCDTLRDPQSASIIRQRFATETLNGVDQANLLGGLRHVGGAEDVPLYVERILRGGTNDDVRGSERTYLSEYASLYVQTLGKAAVAPLAQALDRASNERVRLELLDALRGTVKGADPDAARAANDRIFALLLDPAQSMKLRREAADTICYFDDPALGARLYALRDKVGDKALADRIIDLYASFF